MTTMPPASRVSAATRRFEALVFFILSVFIWPFIAIGVVGAYGFGIWMYQLLTKPAGL